jgi:hypothetical protein
MLTKEQHAPFDRTKLSKVLISAACKLEWRSPSDLRIKYGVTLRVDVEVTGINFAGNFRIPARETWACRTIDGACRKCASRPGPRRRRPRTTRSCSCPARRRSGCRLTGSTCRACTRCAASRTRRASTGHAMRASGPSCSGARSTGWRLRRRREVQPRDNPRCLLCVVASIHILCSILSSFCKLRRAMKNRAEPTERSEPTDFSINDLLITVAH